MHIFKVPDLLLIIGSGRLNFKGVGEFEESGSLWFPIGNSPSKYIIITVEFSNLFSDFLEC